jgi:hypothetical protein
MTDINFHPPDCVTGVRGQDSQQKGTQALTKINQHENSIVQTNIKVVSWVTKYKEYKKLTRVMSCLKLYLSHIPALTFFYGSTALVGLGLLIFKAL